MKYFATDLAPKAIGPYSQAVEQGGIIYTSGQIPLDPATGELVKGDFAEQVHRVFDNLHAVLQSAGVDFKDVVKATVYLTNLSDFQTLNGIYAQYFGIHKPARSTVGVAALPKGAPVEIDLIAVKQ
jgi:2-iminobutanoate/2-iminopropanoate deaminase